MQFYLVCYKIYVFYRKNVLFCPTATESNESFDLKKDIYIYKIKPFKFVSVFLKFSKDILDPELILLLIYSIVIFFPSTFYMYKHSYTLL